MGRVISPLLRRGMSLPCGIVDSRQLAVAVVARDWVDDEERSALRYDSLTITYRTSSLADACKSLHRQAV
jgi:hypothetical protein